MKNSDSSVSEINIVALHGFTGNGLDFELLFNHLNLLLEGTYKLNIFAPTLLGHGSSKDRDCSVDDYLKQLVKYLFGISRFLKKGSNLNVLLGYSMGARLALLHAISDSALWDALILIGVNPGIKDSKKQEERKTLDLDIVSILETQGIQSFINYWYSLPIIKSQLRAPSNFVQSMLERKKVLNPQGLSNSIKGFGQGVFPHLWDDIHSLRLPVLCMHGSMDKKYALINKAIKFRNPRVKVKSIKHCGHAPHIEDAPMVASAASKFLLDIKRFE